MQWKKTKDNPDMIQDKYKNSLKHETKTQTLYNNKTNIEYHSVFNKTKKVILILYNAKTNIKHHSVREN